MRAEGRRGSRVREAAVRAAGACGAQRVSRFLSGRAWHAEGRCEPRVHLAAGGRGAAERTNGGGAPGGPLSSKHTSHGTPASAAASPGRRRRGGLAERRLNSIEEAIERVHHKPASATAAHAHSLFEAAAYAASGAPPERHHVAICSGSSRHRARAAGPARRRPLQVRGRQRRNSSARRGAASFPSAAVRPPAPLQRAPFGTLRGCSPRELASRSRGLRRSSEALDDHIAEPSLRQHASIASFQERSDSSVLPAVPDRKRPKGSVRTRRTRAREPCKATGDATPLRPPAPSSVLGVRCGERPLHCPQCWHATMAHHCKRCTAVALSRGAVQATIQLVRERKRCGTAAR
jgi:hypothetical protein